ncbi:MAG: hemolysin family protein, partial [Pseudomonas sp.]
MDPSPSYAAATYFADFGLMLFALLLVLLNGFFVAAEFAIVKLRATRVEAIADKNGWRGRILRTVHSQLDAYLSACQLGITLASLGLGWVGEPAFAELLTPLLHSLGVDSPQLVHGIAFFTAFFIISYLHIVVGELAPKSWAIRQPELLSLWTAAPLYLFYWAMYPAIFILNASANAILRIAGQGEPGPHHEHHYSRDELKLILHSSRAGDPSDQDMRVLASAVEMGELEVVDWANSREDLVYLELNAELHEVFAVFRRHKYSRYPVYNEETEEFVGVLHIKDLLLHLSLLEMLPSALKISDLMMPVERVTRHMPLSTLLEEFRKGGSHFALVEEADGKVIGYLTMEDVLEALVGDIQDEHRKAERGILAYQPGKLLV